MKYDRRVVLQHSITGLGLLLASGATAQNAARGEAVPNAGILDGDPWETYLESLKRASKLIHAPDTPQDPMTIASGYKNLHRMQQLAWELAYEYSDPDYPKLFPVSTRNLSHGWNSSKAQYYTGAIDGSRTYKLRGERGSAPFIEIGIYDSVDGFQLSGGGAGRRISAITETELKVDGNGHFEVTLSPTSTEGQWLETTPGENFIFIRQYARDWSVTPPSHRLFVEPLSKPNGVQDYTKRLAGGFKKAADYLNNYVEVYYQRTGHLRRMGINQVHDIDSNVNATMPSGHHFAAGVVDIGPDEALIIDFTPADAPFWCIELGDFWGQTLDYDRTLDAEWDVPYDAPANGSHLDDRQIVLGADGRARIVVSQGPAPSGHANWLDMKGHRVVVFLYRQFRKVNPIPTFTTKVVMRAELAPR